MNYYFVGICLSIFFYILISLAVSRKIRSKEDFYVAGRNAGVFLVSGSMIASMNSTGTFMVDAGAFYAGGAVPYIIMYSIMISGYLLGSVFWGRYIRRAGVITIPEYFGKRFASYKMQKLAALTAGITMTVYMISIVQGMGSLLNVVSGISYKLCVLIVVLSVLCIVFFSGSKGVLITDTIMALLFTTITVISLVIITNRLGGWFTAIHKVTMLDKNLLSWRGKDGALGYPSGTSNLLWGITYGISWMSVAIVAPWQGSRYLMAKNESVVIKSAVFSTIGSFVLLFTAGICAVFINLFSPDITENSQVMIWAAQNVLPTFIGVAMITGILAAGISSATTFLSLLGMTISNDFLKIEESKHIKTSRISMIFAVIIITIFVETNPPALFVIMHFGSSIIAASWMPVAIACIFSKQVTENGAFLGMLTGFVMCFLAKLSQALFDYSAPVWLDSCVVGMVCNTIAIIIGSMIGTRKATECPNYVTISDGEKIDFGKEGTENTLGSIKLYLFFSVCMVVFLIVFWILPFKGVI